MQAMDSFANCMCRNQHPSLQLACRQISTPLDEHSAQRCCLISNAISKVAHVQHNLASSLRCPTFVPHKPTILRPDWLPTLGCQTGITAPRKKLCYSNATSAKPAAQAPPTLPDQHSRQIDLPCAVRELREHRIKNVTHRGTKLQVRRKNPKPCVVDPLRGCHVLPHVVCAPAKYAALPYFSDTWTYP